MKIIIILSLVALATAYTNLDDTLNFEKLVANPSEYKKFSNCILDKAPCYGTTQGFKDVVGEVIRDGCAKCSDHQKHTLHVYLEGTKTKYPKFYDELKKKYDPENIYLKATEEKVAKY